MTLDEETLREIELLKTVLKPKAIKVPASFGVPMVHGCVVEILFEGRIVEALVSSKDSHHFHPDRFRYRLVAEEKKE